jgi:hypothetical protein
LASEVGGSGRIEFISSGYGRKYGTFWCQKLAVRIVLDSVPLENKMENIEFLEDMLPELNAKMDATRETMEKQIGSLVSIMKAARKTDRDEMKQEIRAGQEHIKEVMETQFGSLAAIFDGWRKQMQDDEKRARPWISRQILRKLKRDTLHPLKLAPTSPTSGGRSVDIVCLRTKATEFVVLCIVDVFIWVSL